MKIFDRYYGDPASERERYMKEEGNSRLSALQKNKVVMGVVLAGLAALEIYLVCSDDAIRDIQTVVLIPVLAVVLILAFHGERRECDAWIYGMEDGKFLLLN